MVENVQHYLLGCRKYRRARCNLIEGMGKLNIRELNLKVLLGGTEVDSDSQGKI